jgi:hypothetical protein
VKNFQNESASCELGQTLHEQSAGVTVNAFISEVNEEFLEVLVPSKSATVPLQLKLSHLRPESIEQIDYEYDGLEVSWEQRIYDCAWNKMSMKSAYSDDKTIIALDSTNTVIDTKMMNVLKSFAHDDDQQLILFACTQQNTASSTPYITSEGYLTEKRKHFCNFSMKFRVGGGASVQLYVKDVKGIPQTYVQMLHVTNTVSFCLEHTSEATLCFSRPTKISALRYQYKDLNLYKNLWLPVMAMEAAYGSVSSSRSAIIHNVDVTYNVDATQCKDFVGSFTLKKRFCKERSINLTGGDDKHSKVDTLDFNIGYLCIRYKVDASNQSHEDKKTWVDHCEVESVKEQSESMYTVSFRLLRHQCTRSPCFHVQRKSITASIEWIEKSLPDK